MSKMNPSLIFKIDVPVEPIPKSRPKVSNKRAYTPARTKRAEAMIATYVRSKYKGEVHHGAMGIKIIFVHRRPNSLKGVDRIPKHTRPDGDNLLKLVLDACEGIIYKCDGQFCMYHIEDWYASPNESPYTSLSFYVVK